MLPLLLLGSDELHMGRSFVYPMSASPSLLDFLDFLTVSLTVCITNHSKLYLLAHVSKVVWVIFSVSCWLGWSWMILTASLTWLWAQLELIGLAKVGLGG